MTTHSLTPVSDGISYITSSMTSSRIARRPRAPELRRAASSAIARQRVGPEGQLHALELEQPLVLLGERVPRLPQHLGQRVDVERVARDDHRQAAHELGDHAELDQILGARLRGAARPCRPRRSTMRRRSRGRAGRCGGGRCPRGR